MAKIVIARQKIVFAIVLLGLVGAFSAMLLFQGYEMGFESHAAIFRSSDGSSYINSGEPSRYQLLTIHYATILVLLSINLICQILQRNSGTPYFLGGTLIGVLCTYYLSPHFLAIKINSLDELMSQGDMLISATIVLDAFIVLCSLGLLIFYMTSWLSDRISRSLPKGKSGVG